AGTFADGAGYALRKPVFTLVNQALPFPAEAMTSLRVGPGVLGLGLLEALNASTLENRADPNDANGDGISGRVNHVWSTERSRLEVGRFGWKAGQPTLREQVAAAYRNDIGLTNSVFSSESSHGQPQADGRDDDPELTDDILDSTTFYVQSLAVPARRRITDPGIMRGEEIFNTAQCAACHTPTQTTGVNPNIPEVSNQTIHAFTDLLLHDMGPGLADGRPEFEASGSEWRTPPLWGIGLQGPVVGHTFFLHDGRARNLTEAILWHGGEAEASKETFRTMDAPDRAALLAFLNSL
ncbi:MAG: di-heme oxidoredictase family protein, partial [bacterium]